MAQTTAARKCWLAIAVNVHSEVLKVRAPQRQTSAMSKKFDWGSHAIAGDSVLLAGYDTHQDLDAAQAFCTKVAKRHYENFIISNWFTPKHIKQHIQNIYAFCRYGDDLGDDAPHSPEGRTALLNEWMDDLCRAYHSDEEPWSGNPRHPILIAVKQTAAEFAIPLKPFQQLIEAFKLDQIQNRYASFQELRHYCIHSADPVGHLFLHVYGHDDAALRILADHTCTALQLANHWQDVGRDLDQDRIYMPLDEMSRFGYTLEMYRARTVNDEWRALMRYQVDRTRTWFSSGEALWSEVDPRLAVDLQMFTMGGVAILDAIEHQGYDTWTRRPKVGRIKQMRMLFKCRKMWKEAHKKAKALRSI